MASEKELLRTKKFRVVEQEFPDGPAAIVRHPGAVVILPILDDQHLCMISNRRKAVNQRLVELPAGTLEPNESPQETAKRELAEETGYQAQNVLPLFDYFVSPGIMDEQMHAFLATELEPGQPHLMDDEDIETMVVHFSDALSWIRQGRIRDAKTIATLLFYWQFQRDALDTRKSNDLQ